MTHSPPLMPPKPLCMAIAAPESPAISAWLSLVGIPKNQAATAQMIMATSAAQSATTASCVLVPKSTMFLMVMATVELISVITKTPKKLNTADIKTAARGGMARVATQVAMAFGASVQPLTKMTPSVKRTVANKTGLANSWSINQVN